MKTLQVASPRGFCAGVDRAIEIVERAIELFGPPIYVRHEVVHNKFVVNGLKNKGAIFVETLDEIPNDSIVIFSAHGVSKAVEQQAKDRSLTVYDATCPLVTKVHMEVKRFSENDNDVILIGHEGHPEVEGTLGRFEKKSKGAIYLVENVEAAKLLSVNNTEHLSIVTQTTLSVDDTRDIINTLKQRFPKLVLPKKDDICYATQNRQDAVKQIAEECDCVFVVGSPNSSNSNRLKEIATNLQRKAYLIDDKTEITEAMLVGVKNVGVTAGASAPEVLVQDVIQHLKDLNFSPRSIDPLSEENITFVLPKALR
jgi:4-hydroxy-3-methylbut-2-enyl diphosphate reductase